MATLKEIFSWFETGDYPTQQQFQDTFSSFFHKSEKIPGTQIEGFPAMTPNGLETQIKIWIGMEEQMPPSDQRSGTKTLYIALTDETELL